MSTRNGASQGNTINGCASASTAQPDTKHIIICCDGTWCGDAMGTTTNTKMLADSFANPFAASATPHTRLKSSHRPRKEQGTPLQSTYVAKTKARVFYFQGVAAGAPEETSNEEFLLDAVLALSIQERCVEVYEAIVQHFAPGVKIWLFGHSRCAGHTLDRIIMIATCTGSAHQQSLL